MKLKFYKTISILVAVIFMVAAAALPAPVTQGLQDVLKGQRAAVDILRRLAFCERDDTIIRSNLQ